MPTSAAAGLPWHITVMVDWALTVSCLLVLHLMWHLCTVVVVFVCLFVLDVCVNCQNNLNIHTCAKELCHKSLSHTWPVVDAFL